MRAALQFLNRMGIVILILHLPAFGDDAKQYFQCPKAFQATPGWEINDHDCGDVNGDAAVFIQAVSDNKERETLYGLCCYKDSSLLRKAPPDFSVSGPQWKRALTNTAVTDRHLYRYFCGEQYTKTSIEQCQFESLAPTTKQELSPQMQLGEKVFSAHCNACHKMDGLGMTPIIPALKGDAVVTGPIDRTIDTVMYGHPGTIMLSFSGKEPDDRLTNEEFAAVITYIRNSWGNSDHKRNGKNAGGSVTAEGIAKRLPK